MRVLLDNNIDHRFGRLLTGHEVVHARHLGWAELYNGDRFGAAEKAGFVVLITGDKNMRYQQNLKGRTISIITLNALFADLRGISPLVPQVLAALADLPVGAFVTITPTGEN
ncbi:DUF5615 family PIN-like protein [Fimbriimonas ginsengisoli]|uniref:DUF5615 domain-containing protein n=1 Tax=Fimbriimonas ginsengisoli Gsoil 348 TaxID=661478 RepID=A0A068NQI3_FIMGI|nr:DUF5615 family PIN-like protein [Fimbriimonas ginsengisoli]AIE85681.1 hypothetical protein OP10G_2313 [Fimbriimonas ginsengisoli Gsoil 348]